MRLTGWSTPGRNIGAGSKLHSQMHGIISYLTDSEKLGDDIWDKALQIKIGKTIGVTQESTLRHIIGIMKSIGVIYEDGLIGKERPKINHCITKSGEFLNSLMNMENIVNESKNNEVIKSIDSMYRTFYANVFIYWYVRGTEVHVARTVLKSLDKYGYLDKQEWFILNTYITKTDNQDEEELVERYITDYRLGKLKLTSDNIKEKVNAYNFWTQPLVYSGLVKKIDSKIYLDNKHPELVKAILEDDFLSNINTKGRYYVAI